MASISTDTLRHYEKLGLLPAPNRTAGNYREYPRQASERVKMIRNALAMGFSLKDIGRILRLRDQGGAPCHEVRELAQQKVAAIGRHIEDLTRYRDHLQHVLTEWDDRLRGTPRTERARLLEALIAPPAKPTFHITGQIKTPS